MTSLLTVLPTFQDLKMKSAGKGGFSDGGIVNQTVTLTGSVPVIIAPPKGVNWGGITLTPGQRVGVPGGVTAFNFDTVNDCNITEYLVLEDGTEVATAAVVALTVNTGTGSHKNVSQFFKNNGVLSFPNKLKYVLTAKSAAVPTARVIIKYSLVEYDQPSDEV
jgi:hypothetical protein